MRSSILLLTLALLGCGGDEGPDAPEQSLTGTWFVANSTYRYSLVEDSTGRVTGFGTFGASSTVQVDGQHRYPDVSLFLRQRVGTTVTDQSFSGTYDGRSTITGRRSGTNEVWQRQ